MMRNSSAISALLSAAVGSSMISTRESNDSAFAISTICCFATVSRPTGARVEIEPHPREDRGRVAIQLVFVDEHAEARAARGR